jgi:hypothetical protein
VLIDQIVQALIGPISKTLRPTIDQPQEKDIVFSGSFEQINESFHKKGWSDGLPIVPPTIQKIEEFLTFTDLNPDKVIGILDPSKFSATVWNVAVNGVMAGCRPEYMPILLAIAEVMATPTFGLKHGGSTPGWEAMVILNGPIALQLGFNHKGGVLRPGNQANTSIGRFYRLFARNVAGFLPGTTDMGTFGHMFRAVVPENEQACADIGWEPLHVTRGFKNTDNVITITSVRAVSDPFVTAGESAEQHLEHIVDWVKRMIEPYQSSLGYVETHVLMMSPIIAQIIANGGYSKKDVNEFLMKEATVPAHYFEWGMTQGMHVPKGTTLIELVKNGKMPKQWALSTDPNRMVPLLLPESQWLIVVTGDPTRNRSCIYRQNFNQGYATSKKIELPSNWDHQLNRPI